MIENNSKSWFKLFACCVLVRGFESSLIYDLQRKDFYTLSNRGFTILELCQKMPIQIVKDFFTGDEDLLAAFLDQIVESELGFYTNEPDSFPSIDFSWYSPYFITNAILESDVSLKYDFSNVVFQLDQLGCRAVQIRMLDSIPTEMIKGYLSPFNSTRIKHIELLLPYSELYNDKLKDLKKFESRLSRILIYASPEDKILTSNEQLGTGIFQLTKDIRYDKDEIIKLERFSTNIDLFSEAQSYNIGLNRKLCIDRNGYIKNYLTHSKSFGNINNTKLKEVVGLDEFTRMWSISNDMIEVCQDCQYRYACVSNSDIREEKDRYYKIEHCVFNPYENQWN